MKFKYAPQMDAIICEHEDKIWNTYLEVLDSYKVYFTQYDCVLKFNREWINFFTDNGSHHRIQFKNGYGCYISCVVERNGKIVCTDEEEGSSMTCSWNISSITRNWFYLDVLICSDTNDLIRDLNELLETAKQLFPRN